MSVIYNAYNRFCNQAQSFIQERIPEIPKDFVKTHVEIITYSFLR